MLPKQFCCIQTKIIAIVFTIKFSYFLSYTTFHIKKLRTKSIVLNYSREAKRCLAGPQTSPPSLEPQGSLPCPQEPVIAPHLESDDSSLQCYAPRCSDSS